MVNYREILRMTADGYGIRQIKADAHCSHDTIRATLEAAKAKGILVSHPQIIPSRIITNKSTSL